jgi:glycosyltransferase involved in cell wall biosynthesis
MNTPLISVCIAAFNAEKYLEATLRSIESQTFPNWELIVTEDGSSDRTESFVKDFAARVTQRVIYNRHKVNRGLPASRNTGIAAATGEWVAFLDADDLWKPDHLEMLISASQIEDGDAIFAGSVLYDDATWAKLSTRAPSEHDLTNLPLSLYTGQLSIMSSAVMIKLASLKQFGPISTDFAICNDTEYWLRILSKNGRMCYSGANTCIYRYHPDGLSHRAVESLIESARVCERYASWEAIPKRLARARTAGLFRWAGRMLMSEDPAAAMDALYNSLRVQPFNPKTLALWGQAFLKYSTSRRR